MSIKGFGTVTTFPSEETIWLVKSGDRILGPFFETALIQKLYDREIVVIDEVSRPGGRWHYLREEPAFRSAVEELWRRNQGLREDTDIATMSNTESTSATPTHMILESLLKPNAEPAPDVERSDFLRPAVYDLPISADSGRGSQTRRREPPTWGLWLAALLTVAIAGYVLIKPRPAATTVTAQTPAFDQLSAQALREERTGRFTDALRLLREAHQIHPQDAEVGLRLATLMIKVEHQTVDAKRVVGEVLESTHEPRQREVGQIIFGLAALAENDLPEAQKQFLSALAINGSSAAARFDLGVTAFAQKKWSEATDSFTKCLPDDATHLIASFMLARAQSASGAHAAAEQGLKGIIATGVNGPLRQEAQLLLAGMTSGAGGSLAEVLKIDPFMTDETLFSPLMATDGWSWRSMHQACKALKGFEGAAGSAVQALCELKSDHKSEASQLLADALAKEPTNATLLTMNATALLSFGKDEEAKGALKLAMREGADPIVLNLMARACGESQDAICERENWRKLLEREPQSVAADTGLAKLEYQAGSDSEAHAWLDKAWRLSSSYLPLLQLQDELEQRKK